MKKILKKIRTLSPMEIFAAVLVLALLVFAVKFFTRRLDYRTVRIEVIKKNWLENYDPYGYRVPFWLSDKIKAGSNQKDASGKVIAEVLKVENYLRGGEEHEVYLTTRLLVAKNIRTGRYTFNDKPLDNGSPIELNIANTTILGQIQDDNVRPEGYPTKMFKVIARGRNLSPAIYSKIVPGLKVFERSANDEIATILDVKLEDSTLLPIEIQNNHYLFSKVNQNKDVVITARLKASEIDGRWFFAGHQSIKLTNKNDRLYLFTDKINLYDLEIEDIVQL